MKFNISFHDLSSRRRLGKAIVAFDSKDFFESMIQLAHMASLEKQRIGSTHGKPKKRKDMTSCG